MQSNISAIPPFDGYARGVHRYREPLPTLNGMAITPLTLAALATSAVPDLQVTGYRGHSHHAEGAFSAAVIFTDAQQLIVRVPRSPAAEVTQSAEMLGLAALADGARAQLPFQISETMGMTRAGDTRAVVSTYIEGDRVNLDDLEEDALLLQPIAEALAAIHQLPTSLVQHAGLPVRTADDVRKSASKIVERSAETRLLPDTVQARWVETLGWPRLWDFAPAVVHGSFDADRLLISDDRVAGVLGWNELSVGDPAVDLAWLLAANQGVCDGVLARYTRHRGTGGSVELHSRARFYHELEIAKWLLHGVETHDQTIIDDAVQMLDRLVDRLTKLGQPGPIHPATTPESVDRLLEDLPEVPVDLRSETAEYEALDEDRTFTSDGDFGGEDFDDEVFTGTGVSGTNSTPTDQPAESSSNDSVGEKSGGEPDDGKTS